MSNPVSDSPRAGAERANDGLTAHETRERYLAERDAALREFAAIIAREVESALIRQPSRVAFVVHSLYYGDEPEGPKMRDLRTELRDGLNRLDVRLDKLQSLAHEALDGPEEEPTPVRIWDAVRLQRGGIQQDAMAALTSLVALMFTAEQYTTARYIWRNVVVPQEPTGKE